jgi:hypothetical protein
LGENFVLLPAKEKNFFIAFEFGPSCRGGRRATLSNQRGKSLRWQLGTCRRNVGCFWLQSQLLQQPELVCPVNSRTNSIFFRQRKEIEVMIQKTASALVNPFLFPQEKKETFPVPTLRPELEP